MRAFHDFLETPTPAATTTAARDLTTTANVKTQLGISGSTDDTLIGQLITRATELAGSFCRLARDAAGNRPTFGKETLRATYDPNGDSRRPREPVIYLPWRLPITSITSITEDGVTLSGSDFRLTGGGGALMRLSGDTPCAWSDGKIVATFEAGFASPAASAVWPDIEAAIIEQVRAMYYARKRDPSIRSEAVPDVYQASYSQPGGDIMAASPLLPQVEGALQPYRNPGP